MNTNLDLVLVLKRRNNNGKYDALIERAANFGYHCFKYDSIEEHPEYGECLCPKMQLSEDLLLFPELEDVRNDVMNGVYDEHADEDDIKMIQGWLIEDHATDKFFEVFGIPVPTYEERKNHKF